MANYFVDAAKSIYGGKEWRIIFWTRQIMVLAGKNGKLFCGRGQKYLWRERVANYFLDPANHDFGGKEWQIILWMRPTAEPNVSGK